MSNPNVVVSSSATGSRFDALRRVDEVGEFWLGRELMPLMDYAQWRDFAVMVEKAKASLALVEGQESAERNFADVRKISATRPGADFRLTRFGAYLTAMAGDDTKRAVAEARIYFAVRTREAETTTTPVALPNPRQLAEMVIAEADRADRAEAEVRELAPAAESWQQLAASAGDHSVAEAAQILCRAGIPTGQNKLFTTLRTMKWIAHDGRPYQRQVNCGRLAARTTTYTHPHTGEPTLSFQIRVTPKGIHELRTLLTDGGMDLDLTT